jgi:hypothetical protein
MPPFFVYGGRLTQIFFAGWAKRSLPALSSVIAIGIVGTLRFVHPTAPVLIFNAA